MVSLRGEDKGMGFGSGGGGRGEVTGHNFPPSHIKTHWGDPQQCDPVGRWVWVWLGDAGAPDQRVQIFDTSR